MIENITYNERNSVDSAVEAVCLHQVVSINATLFKPKNCMCVGVSKGISVVLIS